MLEKWQDPQRITFVKRMRRVRQYSKPGGGRMRYLT